MSVASPVRRTSFPTTAPALVLSALGVAGCYDSGNATGYYPYPVSCKSGVSTGSVDTGVILDLDPGYGVGATVEYAGDGAWRFAAACDSLVSGYVCDWSVLVSPIDGTIDSFEPEALEPEDVIQRYPSEPGSTVEDAVLLAAFTADGIDAFTLLATPGAGMRVDAKLDGYCGGPYLFWTDGGKVRTSPTNPTDLFPSDI
jgi:hypothetical protein